MSRVITAPELVKLRSENQWSELFLAIHKPAVIYSARVNQSSFPTPLNQIIYDGGSGTLANVKSGMTMYVGSTAGAYDKGMVRIRKTPTATVFYIGETAEIEWEDNDYLTVVDEFGLWQRHLQIAGTLALMDGDVGYSDQHNDLAPVPVLGPPAVLWLTGEEVTFEPDASDSWVLGSTIASYLWTASGASDTEDLDTATPTITYDAVGQYRVSCTVTAANGKSTIGYRIVFVYSEESMPITQFELRSCAGDLENGGWSFSVDLYDQIAIEDVRERALVVLFSRDHYGGVEGSLGDQTGYENIIAVGWIKEENLQYSSDYSTGEFTVEGAYAWLKNIPGYPVGLEYSDDASAWTQMDGLTMDRSLWHLLHWRSTATLCMDIFLSGETSKAPAMEAPTGSLWNQIMVLANESLLALPACNRYNQLYVQVGTSYLSSAGRASVPILMEVTKEDYQDSLSISRQPTPSISMVETSGVAFDGSTAYPYFSKAPGEVLSRYGGVTSRERLLLYDQDHCNTLSGNIYAKENNEYPNIDFSLGANNRFVDIVPNQRLTISFGKLDFPRGITWTEKKLLPKRVSFSHEPESGSLITTLETEAETQGVAGVSYYPPAVAIEGETPLILPEFSDPTWPALTPIGTFFPPYLPPEEPVIPGTDCPADAPANGPYSMNIYGTLYSTNFIKAGYLDCVIRTSAHDNKTTYVINGTFQKLNPGEDPTDPTSYVETDEDDFYDVFVYNEAGTLIATGVHDEVTNLKVRTGVLNAIAASQIHKVEISVGGSQLFRPSIDYSDNIWQAAGAEKLAGDTYKSGNWGSGIWVRAQNIKYGGDYGEGAGGVRHIGVWSRIDLGEDHEYGGKSFYVKQFSWFRFTPLSGGGLGFISSIEGRGAIPYNYAATWIDDLIPDAVGPTGVLVSQEHTYLVTLGEFSDLYFSTNTWGSISGTNGEYLSECLLHQIYIKPASTYRILISQVNLWNICPPEGT